MSDLHQAVQAEIAAHTPSRPPSFDQLKARKRSRDRRRTAAAVTVSVLAVAGAAFVPAVLTGGDGGSTAPAPLAQGTGDSDVFAFHVKATDVQTATEDGRSRSLQRCLEQPGLDNTAVLFSSPPQYTGRVTGRGNADALKTCVEAVPGWGVTLTPVEAADSNTCVGTVTATAPTGDQVEITRDAEPTLKVAVGDRVLIAGDGSCGDAVAATNVQPPPGLGLDERGVVVATRTGRYIVQVTHSMCAQVQDPTCRGGVALDGTFVLDARR